jgi:hypothetical protein
MAGPFVAPAFNGKPAANTTAVYDHNEPEDARRAAEVEFKKNLFGESIVWLWLSNLF